MPRLPEFHPFFRIARPMERTAAEFIRNGSWLDEQVASRTGRKPSQRFVSWIRNEFPVF